MIVRTAKDESPYSEKTSVYFLSYQKSVAGLGTQSQVSQRLFCFFFLRLKKEDNEQSGTLFLQKPSPSSVAATSPEGRGFKYCVYQHLKALRGPGHSEVSH